MATLLNCFQCGGKVSSKASQCQHCTSRYPFGVKCSVCCQTLKRSEAIKISKEYGGAENRLSVKFFHRSCHNQVSQLRMGRSRTSCPVCKLSIEFDTSSSITCHHCGQNFPTYLADPSFASCCYCGFRLNKNLEVALKDVERQFLDGWITEKIYAHRVCYTNERQEQERALQNKERFNQEKINRKRAEIKRNKKSERNLETLALSIVLGLAIGGIFGWLGGGILHSLYGFGSSWKSAAWFGFSFVFVLTVAAVWIFSLFE